MKKAWHNALYALLVLVVLGMSYDAWQLDRSWNYSQSYEDKVRDTVKETVKPECLR